jgi:hypothetical protein
VFKVQVPMTATGTGAATTHGEGGVDDGYVAKVVERSVMVFVEAKQATTTLAVAAVGAGAVGKSPTGSSSSSSAGASQAAAPGFSAKQSMTPPPPPVIPTARMIKDMTEAAERVLSNSWRWARTLNEAKSLNTFALLLALLKGQVGFVASDGIKAWTREMEGKLYDGTWEGMDDL